MALLACATRVRLLFALLGGPEHCVSDLTRNLGLPHPSVSHHLGQLRMAGLVRTRRQGKQIFNRLTRGTAGDGTLSVHAGSFVVSVGLCPQSVATPSRAA